MSRSWERGTDYSDPLGGMSPEMGGSKEGDGAEAWAWLIETSPPKGALPAAAALRADASLTHPQSACYQLALRSLAHSHTHSSILQMRTENWLVPALEGSLSPRTLAEWFLCSAVTG